MILIPHGKSDKNFFLQYKPREYCEMDEDCVCGGVDMERSLCFIGNKDYYAKHIDSDKPCPAEDFCEGPNGGLMIKCINNRCK